MSYDRLLRYVFDDVDKRPRPASYIIRERSDGTQLNVRNDRVVVAQVQSHAGSPPTVS